MGWSCAATAAATMNRLALGSRTVDGSSNSLPLGGFWEVSRTEHRDGAITGTIYRTIPNMPGYARRAGGFRIEPDGRISRGPKDFRALVDKAGVA